MMVRRDLRGWQKGAIVFGFLVLVLLSGCIIDGHRAMEEILPPFTVYGELKNFHEDNDSAVFKIQSEFVNWKLNKTNLEIKIENLTKLEQGFVSDLKKGDKYAFYFFTGREGFGDQWRISKISENFTEYQLRGIEYRKNDLNIDPVRKSIPGEPGPTPESQKLAKTIFTVIEPGEPAELQILLINNQDYDIKYKIIDVKIVNEQASHWWAPYYITPPYEERLQNAIINECEVSFDTSEQTMQQNSTKLLTFIASCPRGDITKTFEECVNHSTIEGINCTTRTASRNDLMLWGEIEFTDGVGNKHVIPRYGIFNQDIQIKGS